MTISRLSLGQRIRHYRTKTGLSQRTLAAIVGISPSVLSRYESDFFDVKIVFCPSIYYIVSVFSVVFSHPGFDSPWRYNVF
ncbi:MAG: helix-turn-helix domain-containing protein [Chitinispirillales bacterium]|jgi:transcriptional regulator with XRE-family HTH domain|nr:helix-turn-helix domain-containing protein [Chitinispirillales bacterium]